MGYLSHRVRADQIKPGDHIYTYRTAFTYSHHGIYVGENKVIHFTDPETAGSGSRWNLLSSSFPSSCLNSIDGGISHPKSGLSCDHGSCFDTYACGFQPSESGVIISCLNCFIGTGSLYLYQYGVNKYLHVSKLRGGTCTIAQSDPPEDVVNRAIYLLRNGFGKYDVVRNNCEDFALYCKTGLLVIAKPTTGSSGQVNFNVNAPWKAIFSHHIRPDQIKPGDHIYTCRTALTYPHHGIYVGENKVIHFTTPETAGLDSKSGLSCDHDSCLDTYACGFQHSESGVIISCINCFIGTGSLYLYQYGVNKYLHVSILRGGTCTIAQSDPPEDVVNRAIYLWQNGFEKYNVVRNCEDFALYCKTGLWVIGKPTTGSSGQVNFIVNAPWKTIYSGLVPKVVFSTTVPVSLGIAVGMHCWSKYSGDIGVRDDVEKIQVEHVKFFRGG